MKNNGFKFKRKKVIVFAFEGKNNRTEAIYFSHFRPCNEDYVLKPFSTGVTDPLKMIESTKAKRKIYDYNAKEDKTYIFMDGDNDKNKIKTIKTLLPTLGKDITIIVSNPTFELWFLNHFCKTTKSYFNGEELIDDLKKYIPEYSKNKDYHLILSNLQKNAIQNSKFQQEHNNENPSSDVWKLFESCVIKYRNN